MLDRPRYAPFAATRTQYIRTLKLWLRVVVSCPLMTKRDLDEAQLLDVPAVATLLGVSERTVRRRIHDGDLRCVRLGTGPRAPIRCIPGDIVAFVGRCTEVKA